MYELKCLDCGNLFKTPVPVQMACGCKPSDFICGLAKRHKELLQHTLGDKTFYRNHFCTSAETIDYKPLCELVAAGLMAKREAADWQGGGFIFHATEAGKLAAFAG